MYRLALSLVIFHPEVTATLQQHHAVLRNTSGEQVPVTLRLATEGPVLFLEESLAPQPNISLCAVDPMMGDLEPQVSGHVA